MGFSPMIGAYFAGLSLSFLPYRVQIESKIASLRALGVITFYFMLGTHTHIHTPTHACMHAGMNVFVYVSR